MFNDSFKDLIDLIIETTKLLINLIWTLIKTCLFWIWVFLPIIIATAILLLNHPFKFDVGVIALLIIFNFVWAIIILTAEINGKE